MFKKKVLTLWVLSTIASLSSPASAVVIGGVCNVNAEDACGTSVPTIPASSTLTIRGYAFDLENGDGPSGGGYLVLQNEDSLQKYRIPITRTEARPDVLRSRLTGDLTANQITAIDAGFVAQIFTASLPAGRYSVIEAQVTLRKAGNTRIDLARDNRAIFILSPGNSPFLLFDEKGDAINISMRKENKGPLTAAGYPALRDGNYTIKAAFAGPGGTQEKTLTFKYQRPTIEVPVSMPLVESFPGVLQNTSIQNPLTNFPLTKTNLSAVVESVSATTLSVNGKKLNAGETVNIAKASLGGYGVSVNDSGVEKGEALAKLYIAEPDAPHVLLKVERWNPHDKIEVKPSKQQMTALVEDFTLDSRVIDPTSESCVTLSTVRQGFSLPNHSGIVCGMRWGTLPLGMKHNPYRSNSLIGTLPSSGDHEVAYESGVIYTDPVTKKPVFYKTKDVGKVVVNALNINPIEISLVQNDALSNHVKSSGAQFPGKALVFSSESGQLVGNIFIRASFKNLTTKITYPGGQTKEYISTTPEDSIGLIVAGPTPWETYDVKVESWYTKAPTKKTERIFQIVALPAQPNIVPDRDLSGNDASDTLVSGRLGAGRNLEYSVQKMGRWQVTLWERFGSQLGSPVDVKDDGTFTFNLGKLTKGIRTVSVKAKMYDSTGTLVNHEYVSSTRSLIVESGAKIEASLGARQPHGPAPFSQDINLVLKDPQTLKDLGTITWEKKDADGSWVSVASNSGRTSTGLYHSVKIADPKIEVYRAIVTNRHSGVQFTTEPINLHAYNRALFEITSPGVVVAKKPVTLTVQDGGQANIQYTWKFITDHKTSAVSSLIGKTLTFTPEETKSYAVEVKARDLDAPDTPSAYTVKAVSLTAANPLATKASISGSNFMEIGKTYTLTAKINDPIRSGVQKNYEVKGFWSFANGDRVDSSTLQYTAKEGENALNYVTYVDGYPEETVSTVYQFRTWKYAFPAQWQIKLTPIYLDTPALIKYTIEPVGVPIRDLNGEPLTYTWSLPSGVTRVSGNEVSGMLGISQVGTYQVAVQVADSRGNVVNVHSDQFSIQPPATVKNEIKLTSKYGLVFYAPADYYLGAKILEIPRGDTFAVNEVLINDQKIGEFIGSGTVVRFSTSGDYKVTLRTLTRMNNYGESSVTIRVEDSPKATCSVATITGSTSLIFTPTCISSAGYVASYLWTFNLDGAPQKTTSKTAGISKTWISEGRVSNLELTVTTTIGAVTKVQVPIPN